MVKEIKPGMLCRMPIVFGGRLWSKEFFLYVESERLWTTKEGLPCFNHVFLDSRGKKIKITTTIWFEEWSKNFLKSAEEKI